LLQPTNVAEVDQAVGRYVEVIPLSGHRQQTLQPGNPFDELIVSYYGADRLLNVAKVRNGFVPQLRREVATKFKGLQINTCPFANLPERKRTQWALTKEEMKNCVWLKPELVAQIEFTEWTPDGHLRHSKFVGLREDKDAREVVREVEG
jgi:ATP-dependent DNA ligase